MVNLWFLGISAMRQLGNERSFNTISFFKNVDIAYNVSITSLTQKKKKTLASKVCLCFGLWYTSKLVTLRG